MFYTALAVAVVGGCTGGREAAHCGCRCMAAQGMTKRP